MPHNSLYLAKRRSDVEALFCHHDELRENGVPPLTATYRNARPEISRRTIQQNLAGSPPTQSSEM
jgi:hypothetical protein